MQQTSHDWNIITRIHSKKQQQKTTKQNKTVKASFFNMLQHTKKKKKKKKKKKRRVRIALNAQLVLCNLSQIFATRSGGMIPNGK